MKRILCIATAIVVIITMFATGAYAKTEFTPSVSYKDSPTIVPVKPRPDGPGGSQEDPDKDTVAEIVDKDKDEVVKDVYSENIVVTPVADADTSTDIPQESKDKLIEVYDKLEKGEMELPYEKIDPNVNASDLVIRDLFDITIVDDDLNEVLLQDNTTIKATFDLGIAEGVNVYVMVFVEDEWIPAVSVTNNGDGTITVELSNTGTLAFSVEAGDLPPAQTGDTVGADLPVWIGVMAVAAVALIVVLVLGNRKKTN